MHTTFSTPDGDQDKPVRIHAASHCNPIRSNTIRYDPIQSSNSKIKTMINPTVSLDGMFSYLPTQQDQRSGLHASAALGTPTVGLKYCPLHYWRENLTDKGLTENVYSRLWDAHTKTNLRQPWESQRSKFGQHLTTARHRPRTTDPHTVTLSIFSYDVLRISRSMSFKMEQDYASRVLRNL